MLFRSRARQEAENVLVVKEKSRLMSPEMKQMMRDLRLTLEDTIPFTVSDVNSWAKKKSTKQTFSDFIRKSGVAPDADKSSVPSGLPEGWSVQERK